MNIDRFADLSTLPVNMQFTLRREPFADFLIISKDFSVYSPPGTGSKPDEMKTPLCKKDALAGPEKTNL